MMAFPNFDGDPTDQPTYRPTLLNVAEVDRWPLKYLEMFPFISSIFSILFNSLIIWTFSITKWKGNSVRFTILAGINILYAVVKIIGADGYVFNYGVKDIDTKNERLRNISRENASSTWRYICVVPPHDPLANATLHIICIDWLLTKTSSVGFIVYLAVVQALCMKDMNYAHKDAKIASKIAVRNSLVKGILPTVIYSTLGWILALYCPKRVHVVFLGLYVGVAMFLLVVSAIILFYIKHKIESSLKKNGVKKNGGLVDRTRAHVIVVVIATFFCHVPYCINYFHGNSALWWISRILFCAYGSLSFFILLIFDKLFRKLFKERLGGVPCFKRFVQQGKGERTSKAGRGNKGSIKTLKNGLATAIPHYK